MSSYRLKTTEPPLLRYSLSHAHYKLSAEYHQKMRLRVQNRFAGCILSCTDTFAQQEVPTVHLRKQGIPVSSSSFRSEHCPPGIYTPGAYSGSLPPSSRDINSFIYRRLVDTSPRPSSITLPPVSVTRHTEYGRPQVKRSKIRIRTSSGYPISGASITLGSGKSFPPSIQSSGDNGTCMLNILPETLSYKEGNPIYGITQLGLRSPPTGSSTFEAPTRTFSLFRSDKPVFTTAAFKPSSPCHPTQAMAGPVVCQESLSDLSRQSSPFSRTPRLGL